jgi:hypothetical protein
MKSELVSHSIAPPADAPSFDIEDAEKASRKTSTSRGLDSRKPSEPSARGLDSRRPATSRLDSRKPPESSVRWLDSRKRSTSRLDSHRTPISISRGLDSHKLPSYFAPKPDESSRQRTALEETSSTAKGTFKTSTSASLRESHPPAYQTNAPTEDTDSKSIIQKSGHVASSQYPHQDDKRAYIPSSSSRRDSSPSTQHHGTTNLTVKANDQVPTALYLVGDMRRTNVEGMVPKSQYDARYGCSSEQKTYPPTLTPTRSMAPPTARNLLVDPEDLHRASRQTQYKSLRPEEQKKQDAWARSMIARTGSCPENYSYDRIEEGYQCQGGHHVISDELLQEGRGGVYIILDRDFNKTNFRIGPYYERPDTPGKFWYSGTSPLPYGAPATTGDRVGTQVAMNALSVSRQASGMPVSMSHQRRAVNDIASRMSNLSVRQNTGFPIPRAPAGDLHSRMGFHLAPPYPGQPGSSR